MDLEARRKRLAGVRVKASAPDGMARVVVDGTGRVVELNLRAELLSRSPAAVAKTVLTTLIKAQDSARQQDGPEFAELRESVDALEKRIGADVAQSQQSAERSLAELETVLSDLVRGVGRRR